MEAQPRARGPYKKHKTEYKISVAYELYSSKKQQEGLTNPLYIRVRAKKQQSYFRSQIPLWFGSNKIDEIIQDPLITLFVEQETSLIKEHLGNYIDKFGDYFRITDWLIDFKEFLSLRSFPDIVENYVNRDFHINLIRNKGVDYKAFKSLVPHQSKLADSLALAKILKCVGVEGLDQIITAISSKSKVSAFFFRHLERWVNPVLNAMHGPAGELLADFIFFNEYVSNKILETYAQTGEDISTDLQTLKAIYDLDH
ncbi:hypothetical protein [Dyadobacter jiangsuensis]|uniref:Uncharacterized protein n=1 Tax=Dyadobacter jiangsuensis TaxID=1591085 RepID=A0A2P8FVH1_9BACT|nr:hypothetical protein [Dyadobacter jiangsuensis]PSL25720.1 hypothetical protein CLV60_111171 [Dyadobacter jiangsuensis]